MSQQKDQSQPQINKIHTSCKECIFAEWDDGITQIGCQVGMLDRLESKGIEIIGVYDSDKEFWVINKHKCPYIRDKNWANRYPGKDLVQIVEKETKLPYQLIVISNNKLRDLELTIRSIVSQKLQPIHVTVIKPKGDTIIPHKISPLLNGHDFEWRIQNILTSINSGYFWSIEQVLKFTSKPFFGVFNAGFSIPRNLFSCLSEKVIKDQFKFSTVIPDDFGNGWIMSKPVYVYWKFHGSADKTMIENIQEYECQTNQHKTITIKELCELSSQ